MQPESATQGEGAGEAWRVSLHGGHSGEFCDHAEGTLREIVEAAIRAGYRVFGVSEHAPRGDDRFLYPEERALGWDMAKVQADFAAYMLAINALAEEYADRLTLLRGFEAEVVPTATYVENMRAIRETKLPDGRPAFDYAVGSVHYVDEQQIDGPPEGFRQAVDTFGGLEPLAVRYYETVAGMVNELRPEVVGHFDLIRKNVRAAGLDLASIETASVQRAAERALEAVAAHNGVLDLNTAGWRKGLEFPYPAPWIVRLADAMGIGFCFGDDSHRVSDVGAGIAQGRDYLLSCGVEAIVLPSGDRISLT